MIKTIVVTNTQHAPVSVCSPWVKALICFWLRAKVESAN